jgi:hypothetical protein
LYFLRIDPNDNEDFREVRTIEEAIKYGLEHHKPITEEKMIQYANADLKKYNIDISRDDYDKQNGEAFHKLDYIFVSEDGKLINESWFVEKYLIGQERLEKKYGCYMMGLDRKLTKIELEWDSLYAELDTKYPVADAERNITRKDKPGLLMRIKDTFGFELDDFPNEQQARLKLVSLLYCFERVYKVEFTSYFNNPTLENVNDIIINSNTKNGYLLEYLRRSIVRDLNIEFIAFINSACCKMVEEWESQLQKLMLKLDTLVTRDTGAELKRSCELILELTKQIDCITEHGKYKHSLLETVYLKLWQHENLGREHDILEVTQKTQEFIASLPDDLTEYRSLAGKTVYKKDMKQFIKDNRKLLAKLAFESDSVTSNQYKVFDLASEKVEYYLDMLNDNTMVNKFIDIPQLLVVAAIQEIINLDKKEVFPNRFYRYTTTDQKTMNTELVYGTDAFRKSQLAWVARVNTRYNAYNGRKDEALLAYKAQSAIDKIIVNLFKTNSITDMLVVHNFYMQLMDEVLLSEDLYNKNIARFEKSVGKRKKGYHIANAYDFQARRLFSVTVNSGIVDQLAKRTARNILEAERTGNPINYWHPIELKGNYYEGDDNYKVGFRVNPMYKEIHVLIFENDMDSYRKQIMKENGITIL